MAPKHHHDILKLDTYVISAVTFAASSLLVVMNYIHHFVLIEGNELDWVPKTQVEKSTYISDMKYARLEYLRHMAKIMDLKQPHPQASPLIYLLEKNLTGFSVQLYDKKDKPMKEPRTPWELFVAATILISGQLAKCVQDEDVIIGKDTLLNIDKWHDYLKKCARFLYRRQCISRTNLINITRTITKYDGLDKSDIRGESRRYKDFAHFSPGALLISIVMYVDYKFIIYINEKENAEITCEDVLDKVMLDKNKWEQNAGTMLSSILGYDNFYDEQLSPTGMDPILFPYMEKLPVYFLNTACTGQRGTKNFLSPFQIHHCTFHYVINTARRYHENARFQLLDIQVSEGHCIEWMEEEIYGEMEINLPRSEKASSNRKKQRTLEAKQQEKKNKEYCPNWESSFDMLVIVLGPRVSTLNPNPYKARSMLGFQRSSTSTMAN